ncbi:Tat pathway signal protein [Streptomyces klenkii]|uniref:Tat pathway signal protein n=1 Tax=Streptomyces klenkii TaxID=1420899 RepID=UPI00342ECFE5
MARTRNEKFAALLAEADWSRAEAAAAFVRVAMENKAEDLARIGRNHITQWVSGSQPSGQAPLILAETLSRRLGRLITMDEIGLTVPTLPAHEALDWHGDPLAALTDLGRLDLDMERRHILGTATFSVAALALPGAPWWAEQAEARNMRTRAATRRGSVNDVEAVKEIVAFFSQRDQRHGGGHGRTAVVEYLKTDVPRCLNSTFSSDAVRRDMFSAAAELTYLSGWMAFDNSEHPVAQRYFTLALRLAAEAGDPPLAAHILRAMAHQALDLHHVQAASELAAASMDGKRYTQASPRERALLGVIHARSLAAAGQKKAAAAALLGAEDDLAAAADGIEEPGRVFFFGEASLSHETACTLRDIGDLNGSIRQFRRSVRTRKASKFARTHSVTLGYLGAVQAQQGNIEEACATWTRALDAMEGVQSGRARETVVHMRRALSPFRKRGVRVVTELDKRAAAFLAGVA